MKTLIALITLVSIESALACSMMPFNVDKAIVEMNLEKVALASLNLEEEQIDTIEILNKDGGYIWNNPMCPEGSRASAQFEVSFNDDNDPLAKGCMAIVTVDRRIAREVKEPRFNIHRPAVNEFKVTIDQAATCLE